MSIKGASARSREQAIPKVAEVEALAKPYQWIPGDDPAGCWCSLRFREPAALGRDRVDLGRGEIRVTETLTELVTGERFTGAPKTAAGRGPSLSHLTLSQL